MTEFPNTLLTFYIEEPSEDYCPMCQALGEPQYGVKMHRSLPTQVHWVRATAEGLPEDKKYVKLCSDYVQIVCMMQASQMKLKLYLRMANHGFLSSRECFSSAVS